VAAKLLVDTISGCGQGELCIPPICSLTTRRDDRVHPGHAAKMAGKLEAMGNMTRSYFYEKKPAWRRPTGYGHHYLRDNKEACRFSRRLGHTFLRDRD